MRFGHGIYFNRGRAQGRRPAERRRTPTPTCPARWPTFPTPRRWWPRSPAPGSPMCAARCWRAGSPSCSPAPGHDRRAGRRRAAGGHRSRRPHRRRRPRRQRVERLHLAATPSCGAPAWCCASTSPPPGPSTSTWSPPPSPRSTSTPAPTRRWHSRHSPDDRSAVATFVVPRVLHGRTADGERWSTVVGDDNPAVPAAATPGPSPTELTVRSVRPPGDWMQKVAAARATIRGGAPHQGGAGPRDRGLRRRAL